jgi:hypothetical protein
MLSKGALATCQIRTPVIEALAQPSAGSACWSRASSPPSPNWPSARDRAVLHDARPALTLLAPDIVEAILDGKQGPEVTLARVLESCPSEWKIQKNKWSTH